MTLPPTKRARLNATTYLSADHQAACRTILNAVLADKDQGRPVAESFQTLPSREEWLDYYEVISEPVCLNDIHIALQNGTYASAQDFYDHINLVFRNALFYNEEESSIAQDAIRLSNIVHQMYTTCSTMNLLPPLSPSQIAPSLPSTQPYPSQSTQNYSQYTQQQPHDAYYASTSQHGSWPSDAYQTEPPIEPATTAAEDEAKLLEDRAIVLTAEMTMDRMPPLADEGFLPAEGTDGEDWRAREKQILEALKGYEGEGLVRYGELLERIPEATEGKGFSFDHPLSLQTIEAQVDAGIYQSALQFDKDLCKLFEKARRFYPEGEKSYGDVLVLQRLYHLLTSANPVDPITTATVNFSSVAAGPGHARALKGGPNEPGLAVTSSRAVTKDRHLLQSAWYKGQLYKIGDYVHLINPSDSTKPIIGHIFKIFQPYTGPRRQQTGVSVCWYFRQEQTIHPPDKTFYENEVFKTAHFADHYIEDILEHVGCQFYTKAIRGRPTTPFWTPGWPLYLVDCRYNDREHQMVRIKNWVSCVPEDLRLTKDKLTVAGADIGTLAEFTQVVKPRRVASPFLRGISGPGKLGPFGDKKLRASKGGGDDDDEGDDGEEDAGGTSAGQGAGRSKGKSIGPSVLATPMGPGPFDLPPQASTSGAPFVPTVATPSASAANVTPHPNPLQSFPSSNGGNLTIPPHLQQQQPPKSFSQLQTSPAPLATPSTPQLQSNTIQPQAYQSRPPPQHHFQSQQSSHYLNPNQLQPAYPSHSHPQPQLNGTPLSMARPTPSSGGGNGMMRPPMGLVKGPKKLIDRSVVANAGGANHVQQVGAMEVLSDATVARFNRDPTSTKLLWFSAPPLSLPPNPKPTHSSKYLAFLAAKQANPAASAEEAEKEVRQAAALREAMSSWEKTIEMRKAESEVIGQMTGDELDQALADLVGMEGDRA